MHKLLFSSLILFCTLVHAQVKIPSKIIGNWINEQTNDWEVGFFEDFAVYQSNYWKYETIKTTDKGVTIKLKQDKKSALLSVTYANTDSSLLVARENDKPARFRQYSTGFVPYTTVDNKAFKNSGFKPDTVTIIGYYRNLQEYNKRAGKEQEKGPFSISYYDVIQDKTVEFFADFDAAGRFQLKFPVLNTQGIYMDWGRLTHVDVVEPGETVFLYADMNDFVLDGEVETREAYIEYLNKEKSLIFMGPEARLHNELANYRQSTDHFDRSTAAKKFPLDMEFQAAAIANYRSRLEHLDKYLKQYPTLSDRFKVYEYSNEKFVLVSNLMQHRFDKPINSDPAFDRGYMHYIHENVNFNDEKLITLVRDFSTFINDYLGYYSELKKISIDPLTGKRVYKQTSVSGVEALKYLATKGMFTEQENQIIDSFAVFSAKVLPLLMQMKDSASIANLINPQKQLWSEYTAIEGRPEVKNKLSGIMSMLLRNGAQTSAIQMIDSLFVNKTLKELLIARQLFYALEHDHVPLDESGFQLANQRLTNPFIKDYILKVDNYYRSLEGKQISYQASLKKTDHLKETKNADLLFKELVAPYKGKVIYIDFWGTWCVPCMQQMPYAVTLKKELADKDVVFMYLANNSPENSWTNAIKKLDLTGENVVHYRLPDEQQAMVERKLLVNSFPSYLLIGKDGQLVDDKAPRPEDKQALIEAITKLLKK